MESYNPPKKDPILLGCILFIVAWAVILGGCYVICDGDLACVQEGVRMQP